MLLWLSSGWGDEGPIDLTRDVAFKTANDLGFGFPLLGAAVGVGAGALVPAQPPDSEQVERPIGIAIAATAEPMAMGLP